MIYASASCLQVGRFVPRRLSIVLGVISVLILTATLYGQAGRRDLPPPPGRPALGGSLSGRVEDGRSGRFMARVRVEIWSNGGTARRMTFTDDAGNYTFERLSPGRYVVQASKPGFVSRFHGQERSYEPATPVEISAGHDVRNVDIVLASGGVVTGRLRDPAGGPLTAARVLLIGRSSRNGRNSQRMLGATMSDDRGAYRFFGLPSGEYVVSAIVREDTGGLAESDAAVASVGRRFSDWNPQSQLFELRSSEGYVPTYYPGTAVLGQARNVTIKLGQERGGIDFTVLRMPLASVGGVVVPPTDANAAGTEVTLTPTDARALPDLQITTHAAADGHFQFRSVPPGRYTIEAAAFAATNGMTFARQSVTVNGGGLDGLSLLLIPATDVIGTVRFEGASPPWREIAKLRVTTRALDMGPSDGEQQAAVHQLDGSFNLGNLRPGPRQFGVFGVGTGHMLEAIYLDGRDITDVAVDLSGRVRVTGLEVVLTDQVSELSGMVRGQDGAPRADIVVVAFSTTPDLWVADSRWIRTTRPAEDGRYNMRGVPTGDYWLAAVPLVAVELNEWLSPPFLERLRTRARRVSVRKGDFVEADLLARVQ